MRKKQMKAISVCFELGPQTNAAASFVPIATDASLSKTRQHLQLPLTSWEQRTLSSAREHRWRLESSKHARTFVAVWKQVSKIEIGIGIQMRSLCWNIVPGIELGIGQRPFFWTSAESKLVNAFREQSSSERESL